MPVTVSGMDGRANETGIYLEIPRSSLRMRGVLIWFVILQAYFLTELGIYVTQTSRLEHPHVLSVALIVSALIIFQK